MHIEIDMRIHTQQMLVILYYRKVLRLYMVWNSLQGDFYTTYKTTLLQDFLASFKQIKSFCSVIKDHAWGNLDWIEEKLCSSCTQ